MRRAPRPRSSCLPAHQGRRRQKSGENFKASRSSSRKKGVFFLIFWRLFWRDDSPHRLYVPSVGVGFWVRVTRFVDKPRFLNCISASEASAEISEMGQRSKGRGLFCEKTKVLSFIIRALQKRVVFRAELEVWRCLGGPAGSLPAPAQGSGYLRGSPACAAMSGAARAYPWARKRNNRGVCGVSVRWGGSRVSLLISLLVSFSF